jgi:hypothetical protein
MLKRGQKVPVCKVCGRRMIGSIPINIEFTCFLCTNPNPPHSDPEDDQTDTNWSDKR